MPQARSSGAPTNRREASFLTDPSPWEADGLHFTVEWRQPSSSACWERVERGWEMPEPLTMFWQADVVARALALRADGERVYRVVDPAGRVFLAYLVTKHLARIHLHTTTVEEIPAGLVLPRVFDVLAHPPVGEPANVSLLAPPKKQKGKPG